MTVDRSGPEAIGMGRNSRRARLWAAACRTAAVAIVVASQFTAHAESPAAVATPATLLAEFTAFEDGLGREVAAQLGGSAKHWRQIAPSVHHLATQHAAALEAMDEADRLAALVSLAEFIDAKRQAAAAVPVLADGRTVIGLLDPAQGLGPREITAIADAYGCDSTIYKKQQPDQTLDSVGNGFLAAVAGAVGAGKPTSVVVLGHGLPTEIQSYHIRFERLAQALLEKNPGAGIVYDPRLIWNTIETVETYKGISHISKSGHAFIKEIMREQDAIYGGEMSAHHYFKEFSYCDSGMAPWLLVLEIMCTTGKPLSELVKERIQKFPCSGEINNVVEDPDEVIKAIKNKFAGLNPAITTLDGISMEFADWRFNLRKSNTEPILRLNVESRGDIPLMQEKTQEIVDIIDSFK